MQVETQVMHVEVPELHVETSKLHVRTPKIHEENIGKSISFYDHTNTIKK